MVAQAERACTEAARRNDDSRDDLFCAYTQSIWRQEGYEAAGTANPFGSKKMSQLASGRRDDHGDAGALGQRVDPLLRHAD